MAVNSLTERTSDKSLQSREETRSDEKYARPAVNIIETEDGLTLTADLPGADKQTLEVDVEKGVLTISAPVARTMPGNPLYAEFELATYYRQFSIPEILDHAQAKAEFTNGLLTLRIPKAAAAKPRKIAIKPA